MRSLSNYCAGRHSNINNLMGGERVQQVTIFTAIHSQDGLWSIVICGIYCVVNNNAIRYQWRFPLYVECKSTASINCNVMWKVLWSCNNNRNMPKLLCMQLLLKAVKLVCFIITRTVLTILRSLLCGTGWTGRSISSIGESAAGVVFEWPQRVQCVDCSSSRDYTSVIIAK